MRKVEESKDKIKYLNIVKEKKKNPLPNYVTWEQLQSIIEMNKVVNNTVVQNQVNNYYSLKSESSNTVEREKVNNSIFKKKIKYLFNFKLSTCISILIGEALLNIIEPIMILIFVKIGISFPISYHILKIMLKYFLDLKNLQ